MLTRRLSLLLCIALARQVRAQVGPVMAVSLEGAGAPLGGAARTVYERAGGYPATVGGTLAVGFGSPSVRVLIFGSSAPATMGGSMGRQGADRQSLGMRAEGVLAVTESWAVVGAAAVSRQRLVRTWVAPLPDGGLDVIVPPGPGQLSSDFLSWSGTGVQLGAGAERRLSRRLRLRVLAGGVLTGAQAGNWERYTSARGGTRVAATLEVGLLTAFAARR